MELCNCHDDDAKKNLSIALLLKTENSDFNHETRLCPCHLFLSSSPCPRPHRPFQNAAAHMACKPRLPSAINRIQPHTHGSFSVAVEVAVEVVVAVAVAAVVGT